MTKPAGILRLVVDDRTQARIDALKAKAVERRVPLARMRQYASGARPIPAAWNLDMTIRVGDFQVTYTQEEHAAQDGQPLPMHHLSVSTEAPGCRPPERAVVVLMGLFGLDALRPFVQWPEAVANGRTVLNVVQPIGDAEPEGRA